MTPTVGVVDKVTDKARAIYIVSRPPISLRWRHHNCPYHGNFIPPMAEDWRPDTANGRRRRPDVVHNWGPLRGPRMRKLYTNKSPIENLIEWVQCLLLSCLKCEICRKRVLKLSLVETSFKIIWWIILLV